MKTLKRRMSYTFKRASKAMFVTSSTTCVAFLANYFSPIMPIKAFGIFAAIIIPVNFIMVCWIFPALVIFDEYYLKVRCCERLDVCCPKGKAAAYEGGDIEMKSDTAKSAKSQPQNGHANGQALNGSSKKSIKSE